MKNLYDVTTRQSNVISTPYLMPARARDMLYITNCFTVKKNPNVDALEKAFNNLLKNQDSLRIRITFTPTGHKQYIVDYSYEKIEVIELSSEKELKDAIYKNRTVASYINVPLYKAIIFTYDHKATLMMVFNHLIYDGYSMNICFKQITNYYQAYAKGNEPKQETNYSIVDYYKEDYKYRKSKRFKEDIKYWRNSINKRKDYHIIVPIFKMNPVNRKTITISNEDYKKAYKLSSELKITFPSLITSIAAITLGKYLNRNDFALAHNSYGRNSKQKTSIGCYVAIFLSFYHLNDNDTVEKFLKESYSSYLQSMRHMNTTAVQIALNCLKKELQIMRFNSWGLSFSYLNTNFANTDEFEYELIQHKYQPNQFYCLINDDGIRKFTMDILYQTKVVSENKIDELLENYKIVFNKVVNNRDMLIEGISIKHQ